MFIQSKAAQLGANYIQLVTSRAGNTGSGGFGNGTGGGGFQRTNVTNIGNAYSCSTTVVF